MKPESATAYLIELDGDLHLLEGGRTHRIAEPHVVGGEKWLISDLREGLSRLMTVEGPAKYADLLVRRKLQESGEFEEPVHIFTHWKKKRGKNSTDIFFTAVPTRVVDYYLETLRRQSEVVLTVPMYALLWKVLKHSCGRSKMAVVLRHGRFAEVLIGDRRRVYFANRCVAFDTEPEQLRALWETVRSDLEETEKEQQLRIERIVCLAWMDARDLPQWPQDWLDRLDFLEPPSVQDREERENFSWTRALRSLAVTDSASPTGDKLLFFSRKSAGLVNAMLLAAALLLAGGWLWMDRQAGELQARLNDASRKVQQMRLVESKSEVNGDFSTTLQFVQKIERNKRLPAGRRIINDLTEAAFEGLRLQKIKIDFAGDRPAIELLGEIQAPFEAAHGGYQRFLHLLQQRGYAVEENRFETQISKSQVVLKLSGPVG